MSTDYGEKLTILEPGQPAFRTWEKAIRRYRCGCFAATGWNELGAAVLLVDCKNAEHVAAMRRAGERWAAMIERPHEHAELRDDKDAIDILEALVAAEGIA